MAIESLQVKAATVREHGNSYVLTIPKHYVTNGLLKPGDEVDYEILINNGESTN